MLFITQVALAQPNKIDKLSLTKTVEMALSHSHQLASSKARYEANKARKDGLNASQIPNFNVSGNYTRISNNITPLSVQFPGSTEPFQLNPQILNQYALRAGISETVFAGFKAKYAIESARLQLEASSYDIARDKSTVQLNAIKTWYLVYKMQKNRDLIRKNLEQNKEQLVNTENNAKAGIVTDNDVLRVKLQRSNTELALIDVENNLKLASYNLQVMLGLAPTEELLLDTNSIHINKIQPEFEASVQEALISRDDIKATESRLKSAEQDVNFSKANLYPTLSLGANYQYSNPNPRIFPNTATWKGIWDLGATVSYNLSNLYKTNFDISVAQANRLSLSYQKEAVKEQVQMQLKQQMLSYSREQEKVKTARQAVSQASENYRVTQNKYNGGLVILTDLLDANILLLQANINYENAKADQDQAWYELQYALGKLNN